MPESSRTTTRSDKAGTRPTDRAPQGDDGEHDASSPAGAPTSGVPDAPRSPASYEQARAELEEVVHQLEAGGVTLEQSLALWERGEQLAHACQAFLDGARARLAAADPARPAGAGAGAGASGVRDDGV
ncbi:exodeoxyribonuclease VII small subunit [Frankia sp. AgPm24]|uniref:exodeoxyribonuclease VII small subunit n=1 Tax=Frankia sp. AgPm24 TaxID=631128 RepID=UPI0027E39D57|nr:exodeoxyribonuclease VII small subunit [Frankia sp. AgPm24]